VTLPAGSKSALWRGLASIAPVPEQELDVFFHRPAVFTAHVLLDFQRGMIAALPMQRHIDKTILDPYTISRSTVRTILLRVAMVAAGCDQAISISRQGA